MFDIIIVGGGTSGCMLERRDGVFFEHTRGRMLGGSSGINSHSLVYPNKAMHDFCASISGDECWSWRNMTQYYHKFQSPRPRAICIFLQNAWEDVFASLGAKSPRDGVSGEAIGVFTTTNSFDGRPGKGERRFTGNTYLAEAPERNNLVVETDALVHKVICNRIGGGTDSKLQADGVSYEKTGQMLVAHAKGEVILCASAFGSPKILELSGIGARSVVESAGVECSLDLPRVGENLQDNLNYGPSVEVGPNIETMDIARRDPAVAAAQREEYDKHRTGPLSEGAAYSFAHWPLQLFNTPTENDALQELVADLGSSAPDEIPQEQYNFINQMILSKSEASATVFMTRLQRYTGPSDRADGNYMTVVAMLSHPFSRGSVHIQSADHALQIEKLLPGGNRLPSEFNRVLSHEEEAKGAIRKYSATNYHPCGTCVTAREELGGVVDGQLKIYETVNVRVCDVSIFPIIPRDNILSIVFASAGRGADIVLECFDGQNEWKLFG
ncbi:alcohol oxidase [Xylariaceae sp. FL1272]|nr:alcohol oxidase [Xylariaceae sp. FL1272]